MKAFFVGFGLLFLVSLVCTSLVLGLAGLESHSVPVWVGILMTVPFGLVILVVVGIGCWVIGDALIALRKSYDLTR